MAQMVTCYDALKTCEEYPIYISINALCRPLLFMYHPSYSYELNKYVVPPKTAVPGDYMGGHT